MRQQVRIAEEGAADRAYRLRGSRRSQKMASDASSLDRRLKIGVAATFGVAVLMAGIYFLFARSAQKENQRVKITIARLEGGLIQQQDLAAQARKLREAQTANAAAPDDPRALQKHAADLKAQMTNANSDELAASAKGIGRDQRARKSASRPTEALHRRLSGQTCRASACCTSPLRAFRNVQNGQRLRYAGVNPGGMPLQDSQGNPVYTLEGNGPFRHPRYFRHRISRGTRAAAYSPIATLPSLGGRTMS